MAEAESEESNRLRNKVSEMLPSKLEARQKQVKFPPDLLITSEGAFKDEILSTKVSSGGYKSSSILTKSLVEMVDEDPIKLQNQSCAIRTEIVETGGVEQLVYSSLARLPTYSIGLSSTHGEVVQPAPFRECNVDPKAKSPHHYFQMPELGARVFVGDGDGSDTIACQLFDETDEAFKLPLDSQYMALIKTLYEDDHPGGLSNWLRAQPEEFRRTFFHFQVVLSGTKLFNFRDIHLGTAMVGNLGGKSSRVLGSSSDYDDCPGDETIRQPSDVVEQPGDPVPTVCYDRLRHRWKTVEGHALFRSLEGLYLREPKFSSRYEILAGDALQLTRFDDFVILGNFAFRYFLPPSQAIEIVRKNAFETADVIAAQLVKSAIENLGAPLDPFLPVTAIVIFLDHKEILLGEQKKENMAPKDTTMLLGLLEPKAISPSIILRDDKVIAKSKEEEKIKMLKEEEKAFAPKLNNKIGILTEDHKVKILVGELLPTIPQISSVSLEENEFGMKSKAVNSNLVSVEVQDGFEAPSSMVLIEDDDCKSKEFMISCHTTKWIICGDLQEKTLLCFFNVEEEQYEFYFEDHESMATIIGLGVPHSKVVLKHGSPYVMVVEIPKEDWTIVWAYLDDIPTPTPKGYIMKQEIFPNILHHIANAINIDNIVSKANDGGIGGDNGKNKAQGNVDDSKGKDKASNDDNYGNTSHPNGGSSGAPHDDDKEKKEKDGNNDEKDGDRDDGKISNDGKEVQAMVHLRLLPGGVLKQKKIIQELGECLRKEGEGKENNFGRVRGEEENGEKEELGEIHKEGVGKEKDLKEVPKEEEEKKEEEGHKRVEKKKRKKFEALWRALKGGENDDVVGNQQKLATTKGVEDVDVDENLLKQLEKQIHSYMVFTFTIKNEAGGPLKTIQVTIDPITFQMPCNNKDNYLQWRRFGWFHDYLQVAFGVVNVQVADLVENSCRVLHSSEAKEVNGQSGSEANAKTTTNAYKGKMGVQYGVKASGAYGRTNGLEAKTSKEVHNSWETNKTLTKDGFSISDYTDLNSQQLKYSCFPCFPFDEKEFETKDKTACLRMYENPICQRHQVSCEGTWQPYDSENLEAYELEVSRDIGMTRIYNMDLEIEEETKQKGVWKVGKNLPLCFIQELKKVVYLNHSMSFLTSSTTGVYRLREKESLSDASTSSITQGRNREKPNWLGYDPLVDV